MGKKQGISISFTMPNGNDVVIETGKLADQADGSVTITIGKTILLATVVSAKEAKENQAFFPLSVDYQEKFASAGRIPGNFFRREGRLSDNEILVSRLVDRALRPLFPDGYMNETQVYITLLSADEGVMPDAYAALAASSALSVSDIPWDGPISEVRVAKINGEYIINPNRNDLENASLDLIVAATKDNVMMVEGEADEVSEIDIVEAIKVAHDAIKIQVEAQLDLAKLVGDKALIKRELEESLTSTELKETIENMISGEIESIARGALDKLTRKNKLKEIEKELKEKLKKEKGEEWYDEFSSLISTYFDKTKKEIFRNLILEENLRMDGRKPDEIRTIWSEIDLIPSSHGSAVFTRGETQVLSILTLGTKMDQIMVDNALNSYYDDFILHYSFPGFSVGEVKPMRGPGRREVGHGNLAGRSLRKVLPEDFPYTIRITSDVLESNGSSSMATVCSGSMALMDAGVPIKEGVSGIAMGLITNGEKFVVLSDILGDEDAIGDMDFKVTGTKNGIVACQMDIKIDGLPYEILEKALMQAKEGRAHILNEMNLIIDTPREDLKPHAPRISVVEIKTDQIGEVIGPGGKVIQEIQKTTNTTITITEEEDRGLVHVFSTNKDDIEAAIKIIKEITYKPQIGDEFDAVVKTVMPYGVFVDFLGKKSGLVHVSELSYSRIENVEDAVNVGDRFRVKLIDIDPKTKKLRLSRKALLPKPDYIKEREERGERDDRKHYNRGNDRRGGDRRGGDRRGGNRNRRDGDNRRNDRKQD
jgi:polyribonucleotide nucleotidyltransferase